MKKIVYLILIIFTLAVFGKNLFADEIILSSTLGVSTGYSLVSGYYSGKLEPGPHVTVYYIPFIGKYLMSEVDVSWSRSQLSGIKDSSLSSVSLAAGPVLKYNIFQGFDVFAGTMFKGSFLFLHAETTGRDSQTFKPGFNLLAGFYADIPFSLRLRTAYTFSQFDLSERSFIGHEISAGVSMGFYTETSADTESDLIKVRKLFKEAVILFNSGNYNDARKQFKAILEIDSEHGEARKYIGIINDSVSEYEKALVFIGQGDKMSAIDHLENTHRTMKKASTLLDDIRQEFSDEKNKLKNEIKKYYSRNDYENCMKYLSRLKKIDPEDRFVKIYLPRVRKRMNTLRKFQ